MWCEYTCNYSQDQGLIGWILSSTEKYMSCLLEKSILELVIVEFTDSYSTCESISQPHAPTPNNSIEGTGRHRM